MIEFARLTYTPVPDVLAMQIVDFLDFRHALSQQLEHEAQQRAQARA